MERSGDRGKWRRFGRALLAGSVAAWLLSTAGVVLWGARDNARHLGYENIRFLHGDWCEALPAGRDDPSQGLLYAA